MSTMSLTATRSGPAPIVKRSMKVESRLAGDDPAALVGMGGS
jgi:hypothetical protein